MPILTRPAFGPVAALAYVTFGTLLCVWTLVWYFTRDYELNHSQWFWLAGLFFSGLTFLFLGLVLGRLGRAARQAELPPHDATATEAAIQEIAAAHQPVVAPGSVPAPVVPPGAMGMPVPNPAIPPQPVPPTSMPAYPAH